MRCQSALDLSDPFCIITEQVRLFSIGPFRIRSSIPPVTVVWSPAFVQTTSGCEAEALTSPVYPRAPWPPEKPTPLRCVYTYMCLYASPQ